MARRSLREARVTADDNTTLGLARQIYELGGIEFGSFTLGRSTVDSPVYVNPKRLIAVPAALRAAADLVRQTAELAVARLHHPAEPWELVAGVPLGGLHLATAYSLATDVPLVYLSPRLSSDELLLEGRFLPGQHALLVDDLITTGGSVIATANAMREQGLVVRDVIVLIDRDLGAARRLQHHGLHLLPILSLRTMLNFYMSEQLIREADYRRSLDYIARHQVV
ncbi:MAG: phosphoribosyltransferase family protein [Chloroflexi bacterium]|nr:phosphoribosyltransferase family protein [Chloroflexota bacterium]MCY4111266.1 phosphoribosyltransferase family protein [Chloroflexota bacterium]